MKTVDVEEAQANLSDLLADVEQGEDVTITRDGIPVARLVAIQPAVATHHEPGLWSKYPGWEDWSYDPAANAPMTDREMENEGWI